MSIDLSIVESVANIIINNPSKKNALNLEMRRSFLEAINICRASSDIRAVLIRGEGGAFCSGADVSRMGSQDLLTVRQRLQEVDNALILALNSIEKPVIAAVQGPAVGMGWSIALACDSIVAAKSSSFCQIFLKVGLAPDTGSAWLLARRAGWSKAKELALSCDFVGAEEASELGLVDEVCEDCDVLDRALELAKKMAEGPTFAIGLTKTLFNAAFSPSLSEFLEIETMVVSQLTQTADHLEGIQAFKEKRLPQFRGR